MEAKMGVEEKGEKGAKEERENGKGREILEEANEREGVGESEDGSAKGRRVNGNRSDGERETENEWPR